MGGMEFDVVTKGFLSENLEKAAKQFPYSTEKILKKEARNIAKDLGKRVSEEAKGHHYQGKDVSSEQEAEIIKNRLENSFRQGKVIKSGSGYRVAVTTSAPHYHFYEEGHTLLSHEAKKGEKGGKGSKRYLGVVKGRKTVARYMAQRSEFSELIGEELLNEILKDAGLD